MKQLYILGSHLKAKWGYGLALVVALLAIVLGYGMLVPPPTAHAFSWNGQEAGFYTSQTNSVYITGPNQDNHTVGNCFNTTDHTTNGNVAANWWWIGTVYFDFYSGTGCRGTYLTSGSGNIANTGPGVVYFNVP